jgi:hypothetical protein
MLKPVKNDCFLPASPTSTVHATVLLATSRQIACFFLVDCQRHSTLTQFFQNSLRCCAISNNRSNLFNNNNNSDQRPWGKAIRICQRRRTLPGATFVLCMSRVGLRALLR